MPAPPVPVHKAGVGKRRIWHVGFERNVRRRGPSSFAVRSEEPLSHEPLRPDYLFLRKLAEGLESRPAETLRRLWPLLPKVTVGEYKSPSSAYKVGDLDRLWGYVHVYFAQQRALPRKRKDGKPVPPEEAPEITDRAELAAALFVPERTPSLTADIHSMGLAWEDLDDGYWKVTGGLFVLHVAELDRVAEAEGDDLLHLLGHEQFTSPAAQRFWTELMGSKEADVSMVDMEGFREAMDKFYASRPPEELLAHLTPEQRLAHLTPEQRLAGLPPEQRLAGLPPEQRLADLDRDHQALALPVEVLRVLPDDYVRSLSPDVQSEIRRRQKR